MNTIYQTSATITGGRDGHVTSDDGLLSLDVRTPKEMGGTGGHTNPEQLFAAGYAACFDSALNLIMRREKVRPENPSTVTATVGIGPNNQGGFQLTVKLGVHIPGIDRERGLQLVDMAHAVCPYSNATRGNIDVDLAVLED